MPRDGGGRFKRLPREDPSRGHEYFLRVGAAPDEAGERDGLFLRRTLALPHRRRIAPDLRVHGLAQPQPLVPQLGHVLGVLIVSRGVYAADRFQ